ncbi:MAG TPA: PrsW family intramembrane metalloprotease [Thermomicrobiales bacterium]|nr:PrsW family intramembrane metalloprotease [Thermomicrobiales bacterium]
MSVGVLTTPARQGWLRLIQRVLLGGGAMLITLCVLLIVIASVGNGVALGLATALSIVPTIGYGWLVLRLDRYEAEPAKALAASFLWGAIGAVGVAILLELVLQVSVRSMVLEYAVNAPLIEESAKGVALLAILVFYRHELDNVLDGVVYGALIGLGFATTENILYLGSAYAEYGGLALTQLFIARAVLGGFGHAAYTAMTGAAIGWAREQHGKGAWRFIVPIGGWAAAVALHALWNGGTIALAAALGDGASPVVVVFVLALVIIVPATAIIFVVARLVTRRELAVIRTELAPEVERGTLTPQEYEMLGRDDLRGQALRAANARGGRRLRRLQDHFMQVASNLAFRQYHLGRGEALKPGQEAEETLYRQELARLRAEIAATPLATATQP